MVPVESSGHDLVITGIWHKISRQLPGYKLVVGLVSVEGFDNPVPPRPLRILEIIIIAVAVPIPRTIQPPSCHALPITGRTQKTIHNLAVCFLRLVSNKGVHLLDTGRKSCEIDRYAPDKFLPRGFLLQLESSPGKPLLHENIDHLFLALLQIREPALNR